MLHQLYQYDDAIIRWSWRQVRGGSGGAGITADDDDTGTALAVSNIGLVKWWLRLMSSECSSLIQERGPLRYWLSVARRWEFHRIWECNLSSWLRCFVVKAPAVSISPSLSLGGPSRSHCRSLVTMILVELQTAKSSSSKEWMNEVCTHSHSHSLTLRHTYSHTVMQVPKWRCSNQVSESVNEPAIGRVWGK